MYGQTNQKNRGFLALTTTMLVSAALIILVIAVGFEGFFARFSILESELKEESVYLAEACVEIAILKIAQDEDYAGGETVPVGAASCDIDNVSGDIWAKIIETTGVAGDAYTHLEAEVNMGNPTNPIINSWEETI